MRSFVLTMLAVLLLTANAVAEPSSVTLKVLRTSPSDNFVLARFQRLYLEIAYEADQPLRLQARAYSAGMSVDKGQAMNASVSHPAGQGRALVWVSYSEPAIIDEIRISAYDDGWKPLAALSYSRPAQWLAKAAESRVAPRAWVQSLIADEEKIAAQYRLDHPPQPDRLGDLLFGFVYLSVPGYFVLQVASLFMLRKRWRLAAMAPLAIMVPAAFHAAFALSAGSNIWPIILFFAAPIGFVYLVGLFVLLGARRVLNLV
jgi:hypothetical protein